MGKRSRRRERSKVFETPIRLINEDTGELIEEFVNPKVARFFNEKIKAGATKDELTELVSKMVTDCLEEKRKNAPIDGQHRKDI
jgi:hypothetical protein